MHDIRCAFLESSQQAVQIDASGEKPATVDICGWPDYHPERFVDAPLWLLKLIGSGLMVHPQRDCIGCNGYRSELPHD